ncbi:putative MFS transporter [Metarhizium anisopliae]
MDIHQDTEQTALLREGHDVHGTTQDAVRNSPPSRLAVALSCLLLLALVDIGNTLISSPIEQIRWETFCYNPNTTSIPSVATNPSCAKKDYALLQSWKAAVEIVMIVLTAAPFGMAADAYGRRRILQLSVAGITSAQAFDIVIGRFPETFPVHLMVWKGFWAMIGGGGTVFSAMIFTIFSDISTEAQR